MNIDSLGIPIYSKEDLLDIIYQGRTDLLGKIFVDIDQKDIDQFNMFSEELELNKLIPYSKFDLDSTTFDKSLQENWHMPAEYKSMDIEEFLVHICPKENYQRLIEELQEFRERNMLELLRWLKYFVDTCRKNNVIWGVGRGSSVASYVLYLIGIHKIDPIKYNLDWREFLR
jgi:DNA polymerase III alpha subunit